MAPAYLHLTDTTKAVTYLSKGSDVRLIDEGQAPHWVLVWRGKQQYYLRCKDLDLRPAGEEAPVVSTAMLRAVPREFNTDAVQYTGVERADGLAKSDLFARAKAWGTNAYNSPRTVTKTEDKEAGIVVYKAYLEVSVSLLGTARKQKLYYTATISTKDGRFKYDLTDFYFQDFPTTQHPDPRQEAVETYLDNAYDALGKPNRNALEYSRVLIQRAAMLEAGIKRALLTGSGQ